MKIRLIHIVAVVVAALLATSCGDNSDFRIHGSIGGLGTQNLRVVYPTENGITSFVTTAIDGEFTFTGMSERETVVEIFTTDRVPLIAVVVKNGQTVECKTDRTQRRQQQLSGNDASENLAAFIREHGDVFDSGDDSTVNELIAGYVGSHPRDMASTALMLTEFRAAGYEADADSLWMLLDAEVKPDFLTGPVRHLVATAAATHSCDTLALSPLRLYASGDSMITVRPSVAGKRVTLITVTGDGQQRGASFVRRMGELHKDKTIRLLDIGVWLDTADWKEATRPDSARWLQLWAPGGTAASGLQALAIPAVPYFIVGDSLGRQIWRGADFDSAVKALNSQR